MPPRLTRRERLVGAGAFALLSRVPVGLALVPSTSSSTATPAFIDDLIARMTVEEKAGQLTCSVPRCRPMPPPRRIR